MGTLDCNCPIPSALADVPYNPCADAFGKVGRMVFQRLDDTTNIFETATNDISEEASWTPLTVAVDDTKVVVSPILEDVQFTEPAVLEDSENLDGAPIKIGSGPQPVEAMFRNPTAEQITALKALSCEPNLVVYFIDNNGKIKNRLISAGVNAGIKISPQTFIVTDPSRGGARVDQFKCKIQFTLPSNWFNTTINSIPEAGFDPLNDIKP